MGSPVVLEVELNNRSTSSYSSSKRAVSDAERMSGSAEEHRHFFLLVMLQLGLDLPARPLPSVS